MFTSKRQRRAFVTGLALNALVVVGDQMISTATPEFPQFSNGQEVDDLDPAAPAFVTAIKPLNSINGSPISSRVLQYSDGRIELQVTPAAQDASGFPEGVTVVLEGLGDDGTVEYSRFGWKPPELVGTGPGLAEKTYAHRFEISAGFPQRCAVAVEHASGERIRTSGFTVTPGTNQAIITDTSPAAQQRLAR